MKPRRLAVALVCMALVVGSSTALAEGFQFSDLNPFDGGKKPAAPRAARTESKSRGLSLPQIPRMELPRLGRSPARRTTPTTWQRMQKGTGEFFNSLTSWTKPAPATRRKPRSSGKSPFSWLFPAKPPRKEIRDVNDFLSLPRPDYD